ncbi:MAG: 30S ribosomal protein S20 [Endomicrobiia bacterium]|nr:30S ribosomal protein S20 [Endomicrobiia bacterium]
MAKIKKTGRHTSALREDRRSSRRKDVNDRWRVAIKSIAKKIKAAVDKKNTAEAKNLLREAFTLLDRAAKKKVIHTKKADRRKSRLSKLINRSAS